MGVGQRSEGKLDGERATELIASELGSKRLIWVGYHGRDAGPLTALPQFSHCYSTGMPLGAPGLEEDASLEERLGQRRVALSGWDFMLAFKAWNKSLVAACEAPARVLGFSALPFSELVGQELPDVRFLGIAWEQFQLFNSKPYVEEQLRRSASEDIRLVDWRTLPNDSTRSDLVRAELRQHPVVLRAGASQAGMGHELIRDESELAASRLIEVESLSIGPLLDDHIPLNVAGCVFPDGRVTLHSPVMQLLGLPHTGRSRFSYCGNDFARVKELDRSLIEQLELQTRAVGRWLHSRGYLGAFGVDLMWYQGEVLYTELNPRFQGSTWLLNRVDADLGMANIVQDHLMAWLGVGSHPSPPLTELVAAQPAYSQVVVFNTHEQRARVAAEAVALPEGVSAELIPAPHVLVDPGEVAFALVFERGVTTDGWTLDAEATSTVNATLHAVQPDGAIRRRQRARVNAVAD